MAVRRRMIADARWNKKIEVPKCSLEMDVDLTRMDLQFAEAQFYLDNQVMTDMVPYMPMQTGSFVNLTKARSAAIAGSGKVIAAAPPYGRFLYKGLVMVDEKTGSPFARKGGKKVLVSQYAGLTNAKKEMAFNKSKHPRAQKEWFEAAKNVKLKSWLKQTAKRAGGV